MWSKNKKKATGIERDHAERIKGMPCAVCDAAGPSDAHHIKQDNPWTLIPLCKDCHQGPHNGIHGQRAMWKILKMDEIDALAKTLQALAM